MQLKKKNLLNLFLVFVSILATAVVLEVVLRVTHLSTDIPFVEGDEELGFTFIPNQTGTFVVGAFGEIKAKYYFDKARSYKKHKYKSEIDIKAKLALASLVKNEEKKKKKK